MRKKDPGALVSSPAMALFDAIPVLFFAASAVFVSMIFGSALFCVGAALCVLAGFGKVLWKMIKAIGGKDVRILFVQMRAVMPLGFLLIILSLFVDGADFPAVWKNIIGFPCNILFGLGCAGMAAMIVMALAADPGSARANWAEQAINASAQLCFLLGVIIIWYSSDGYAADSSVSEYLYGSDAVVVAETDGGLFFDGPGGNTALVFYPGAKVEYTAYAPLMLAIAENGTDCFLCSMPYDLAVFDIGAAGKIMSCYTYDRWYVGGHSLGGAMASVFAGGREDVSGLVLLGAYPVSQPDIPTLIVCGSDDGVINREKLEKALTYDNIAAVEINGGNHAGFGAYGKQAGDNDAAVTPQEQRDITARAVRDFISAGSNGIPAA